MSKTTSKPADAAEPADQPSLVPTHGGVYRVEAGVLKPIAGGPPAEKTPATEPDLPKEGAA